jgi:hypothetical protein
LTNRKETLIDKHGNKIEAWQLKIILAFNPNKTAVANTKLIVAAPMLLQEHITDLGYFTGLNYKPLSFPLAKNSCSGYDK